MLYYCPKCGRIILYLIEDKVECDCCHSKVYPVPDEFLIGEGKMVFNEELKQQFIHKYIKNSPEFDQSLFDQRDEILAKMNLKYEKAMTHGKAILESQNKQVTCPYCSSTRVSKTSILGRMVSFEFWGLASNKLGKQWHCHDCGSNF